MITAAFLFCLVAVAALVFAAKQQFSTNGGMAMKAEGDGGSNGSDGGGWDLPGDYDLPF